MADKMVKMSCKSSCKEAQSENNSDNDDDDEDKKFRLLQMNELEVLKEIFPDQIKDLRDQNQLDNDSANCWKPLHLSIRVDSKPDPIAGFDLQIKCSTNYPRIPPAIGFKNVRGTSKGLIAKLYKELKEETAKEEYNKPYKGYISWLILKTELFLENHYHELELNNKSLFDQMVEQKQNSDMRAKMTREHQDEVNRLIRERQVEEIRQKLLKRRELYNESRKRTLSQTSNALNDDNESIYDYEESDLDAASDSIATVNDDEESSDVETNCLSKMGDKILAKRAISKQPTTTTGAISDSNRNNERFFNEKSSMLQSRVNLEYEVIEELGHGGFGTVYKVRNKVDSRLYALKKVRLNPDNEVLNEKIMREVKLLSRLNHENVIRYYTTWIEFETNDSTKSDETGSNSNTFGFENSTPKLEHDSYRLSTQKALSESSDEELDDVYHTSYLISNKNVGKIDSFNGDSTSNYVVFATSDNNNSQEIIESMKKALGPNSIAGGSSDEDSADDLGPKIRVNRWLYIQMELGQGTLKETIDSGLPKQKDRAKRFFREILDGLCHIHKQGIIHRDLKPVNIFLDSMDRPKIGDFGLATTNLFIITQSATPGGPPTAIKPNRMSLEKLRLLASPDQGCNLNLQISDYHLDKSSELLKYIQCNQTDNIGTPLYMSPELSAANESARIAKVTYSHKVDVYSLGIIYFEMLYPFKTAHERIKILQDLRKPTIVMPHDIETHLTKEDVELLNLLLTHDVESRPTSEKLLTSNLLPSVGIKEKEYQNIIKQVVQNRQARTHKHMLRLLFEQSDSFADDFVFDYAGVVDGPDSTKLLFASSSSSTGPSNYSNRLTVQNLLKDFNTNAVVLDQVKMNLEHLLRSKGYVNFVTPTLMSKYSASEYYNKFQLDEVVMLMDKNSSILTLPYDLKLPFAATIARTNINYMNRFAIEKIYRQRQILGYHPDQLWECCVDIVSPPLPSSILNLSNTQSHLADAEILNLMGQVVKAFSGVLNQLRPIIKINHMKILNSILLMLGVKENLLEKLINCITDSMGVSLKQNLKYTSNPGSGLMANNSTEPNSPLTFHMKENLRKDLLASKLITNTRLVDSIIQLLDVEASSPFEVFKQIEQIYISKNLKTSQHLEEIRLILKGLDETIHYAAGIGLEVPIKISTGFVLGALKPITFYSGMICLLECRRHRRGKNSNSTKSVLLAIGGRYDKLIESFSRNRKEVFDRIIGNDSTPDIRNERGEMRSKVAVGVSFSVEKLSRFVIEDYVDKINSSDSKYSKPSLQQLISINTSQQVPSSLQATLAACSQPILPIRYWLLDIAICSLTYPRGKGYISILANMIKQLREKGLMCGEILPLEFSSFTLNSLMQHCFENRVPYVMTIKCKYQNQDTSLASFENDDEFLQEPQTTNLSSSLTKSSNSSINCTTTLYQFDKSRLREIKRCDHLSMIEFLVKK